MSSTVIGFASVIEKQIDEDIFYQINSLGGKGL
jgi:hypothetical protein